MINAGRIKLGTIFSGIGAVERALRRLKVDYDVCFACDNGDRFINIDYAKEFQNIRKLNDPIEKKKFVEDLYKKYSRQHNFVQDTYLANYHVLNDMFYQDVKLLDGNDYKNKIDFFVGGSPCQSFSIAGKRGGFEDTRGTLFYEFARLVKEIQPKVFIYENVFGVLNHDHGKTWQIMQNTFKELGYDYKWSILNSKNYGIPQSRKRLFVVGFKNSCFCYNFKFPKEIELKFKMQDFLLDNVPYGNFKSDNNGEIVLKKEYIQNADNIHTKKENMMSLFLYNDVGAEVDDLEGIIEKVYHKR